MSERLTAQFYNWELRGRGWHSFETSVDLEPPFYPFFGHTVKPNVAEDDGYKPNICGRIANIFKQKNVLLKEDDEDIPFEAYPFICNEGIEALSISVPKDYKIGQEETRQLLVLLSNSQYPISFEILASAESIVLQFTCRISDSAYLQNQVKAYFPGCQITIQKDRLEDILQNEYYMHIQEYGLKSEFMCPLVTVDRSGIDPYIGFFASLENLERGEHAVLQILFKGAVNPWSESIMRAITGTDGKSSFFADAPEMINLAKEKVSSPLHAVVMRTLVCGQTEDAALALSNRVQNSFVRVFTNFSNTLIPLQPSSESFDNNLDNFILRESQRLGILLNTEELARVVHLPSAAVLSTKLVRDTRKTKAAPAITLGHRLELGINRHQGKECVVTLANGQRLKHTHVIGATGTGKSTFLTNIIVQDIQNGEGVCVLDPHGDLIEGILPYIPQERIKDVIVIDPADAEYPIGFNILSAYSEIEKDILSSDLVSVFKRLSTSWGDQMNSVLANAILAFLESSKRGTLVDLRRFLVEKSFRDDFLKSVSDPSILYYWQKEYALLKTNSIGSILTRLDTFLRPKLIRNMVAQKKGLDFEDILDSGKIVLAKLSQGLIGNENSYLLGTFFVTKIYQAAMARQAKGKDSRRDFFLYIDEFQNFITPSMSAILSGARKYHLGMVLAHQDMQQLQKYDTELASSVSSNAGTRICFRLGDTDAKRFESGFSFFDRQDLENLNTGEAICRIERPDFDFSLTTLPLQELDQDVAEQNRHLAITHSRVAYGTPKADVEQQLSELLRAIRFAIKEDEEKTVSSSISQPKPKNEIKQISKEDEEKVTQQFIKKDEETKHRYLQNLIKRMAESRGYKAVIEHPTQDGAGRVDVHLERNGKLIACEVCVTTEVTWEIHNIEKCLTSGYHLVAEISTDQRTLENLKGKIADSFPNDVQDKILVLSPDALFEYLDTELAKESATETRVKGYRVKVEYGETNLPNPDKTKDIIIRAITNSSKGKNKKGG